MLCAVILSRQDVGDYNATFLQTEGNKNVRSDGLDGERVRERRGSVIG